MLKLIKLTCVFFCLFIFSISNSNAGDINVVTSAFAPFNYVEDGKNKGFCTEIIQAILEELEIQDQIQTYPWARTYQIALKQKNTLIYTIARTPQREKLFHWVGIIISGKSYLFSLRKRNLAITSLQQAGTYNIGAVRNGIRSKHLYSKGIINLDLVEDSQTNAVKLMNNRIDLWVEDELSANYTVRNLGYNPHKILRKAFELDLKLDGYMAFSLNTDEKIIELFKKTLKKLIDDGTYTKIKNKYI